ncbi:hypothetical protein [Duncaniella freteri]|nr:hypothetical protein [Duncaniella freteri]
MSVAKNGGNGVLRRLHQPVSTEVQDYPLPPATTLRGGRYPMALFFVYL